jgi:hypothetical protein
MQPTSSRSWRGQVTEMIFRILARLILDDQVSLIPRGIFDKAKSKRSGPNEELIVNNYERRVRIDMAKS